MIDEFLNSAQSEYDSLKAHCDFIERENRALTKEIEMCDKKIDKLRATRDKAIDFINNNGEKQYNHHDNYRGKWYSPDELDTILDILKEVE